MLKTAKIKVRVKGTDMYWPVFEASGFTGSLGSDSSALSYDAAGTGRRARTWRTSAAGPNASLTYALPTLINRSRDAIRKNPYADSAVDTIVTNIVGTGIKPQFRTPDPGLNRDLSALWLDWTDEADADGHSDWYGMQALAVRAMVEAGEVFSRFRVRRPDDEMSTVPLQLQLLESEYCPVNEFQALSGREVRNGIEFDLIGKRTAYWMYRQHPQDWSVQGGYADLRTYPVPASEVLHIYQGRRPGQIRGEPWLTRALIKLRDLDAYDDAELARKKTAALIAGFVTKQDEFAEFAGGGDGANSDLEADSDGAAPVVWEPGTLIPLDQGEDVTFSEPTDVGGSYEPFMRQQLRAVSVAAGTLYEQLTGDYSTVNDRTFRASVNEFRRRAAMWQHGLVVYQLCRPVVNRWLDLAVLSGAISVPASFNARDLYRVKWVPEGWSYIHPVQEVQAAKEAVRSGFKSRAEVVSEQGYDVEEIDREIAEDNARADQMGNAYDSDGRRAKSGSGGREPSESDRDEAESERENADA